MAANANINKQFASPQTFLSFAFNQGKPQGWFLLRMAGGPMRLAMQALENVEHGGEIKMKRGTPSSISASNFSCNSGSIKPSWVACRSSSSDTTSENANGLPASFSRKSFIEDLRCCIREPVQESCHHGKTETIQRSFRALCERGHCHLMEDHAAPLPLEFDRLVLLRAIEHLNFLWCV